MQLCWVCETLDWVLQQWPQGNTSIRGPSDRDAGFVRGVGICSCTMECDVAPAAPLVLAICCWRVVCMGTHRGMDEAICK